MINSVHYPKSCTVNCVHYPKSHMVNSVHYPIWFPEESSEKGLYPKLCRIWHSLKLRLFLDFFYILIFFSFRLEVGFHKVTQVSPEFIFPVLASWVLLHVFETRSLIFWIGLAWPRTHCVAQASLGPSAIFLCQTLSAKFIGMSLQAQLEIVFSFWVLGKGSSVASMTLCNSHSIASGTLPPRRLALCMTFYQSYIW